MQVFRTQLDDSDYSPTPRSLGMKLLRAGLGCILIAIAIPFLILFAVAVIGIVQERG